MMQEIKLKRGYENSEKVLEIIDGNLDLVLYHENGSGTFYYYRFPTKDVLGLTLAKDISIYGRNNMVQFLSVHGKDYDTLLQELLMQAITTGMRERYDM